MKLEIVKAEVFSRAGLTYVQTLHWSATKETASVCGSVDIPESLGCSIESQSLSEEILLEWLETKIGAKDILLMLDAQLEIQRNLPKSLDLTLLG